MYQVVGETITTTISTDVAEDNGDEAMEVEENTNERQADVELSTQTANVNDQNEQIDRSETSQPQPETSMMTPQPAETSIRSRLVEAVVESPDEFRDETKAKASKRAKLKSPEKSPIKSPSREEDVS